jgi:hypothetical protein
MAESITSNAGGAKTNPDYITKHMAPAIIGNGVNIELMVMANPLHPKLLNSHIFKAVTRSYSKLNI